MEISEILKDLEQARGDRAAAVVRAAADHKDEITPGLLRILDECIIHAVERAAQPDYGAHFRVMLLLAQFRETRAYPLVVRFAQLPKDLLETYCGDFLTMDLDRILASVCDGDLSPIQALIEMKRRMSGCVAQL
jgi:hypothetical protein